MSVALPAVTDHNRFYWTSGSDGRLRLQSCAACGSLQHPPAPTCRRCGADDLAPQEVSGGFTFNCLSWIEALGFCKVGEAKDFLDGGKRITLDGDLPVNTHGGQLSGGRTHGMGLVHEAITQLRGGAGERQVQGAATAVASSGGLTSGGVILFRVDD